MPYARVYNHRRRLPHIQNERRPVFLTFGTYRRWELPDAARDVVLRCCLHEDARTIDLLAAVVMPEHVHLLFTAKQDASGEFYSLAEIVNSIKSAAAHQINRALQRSGTVWQAEYFDHVLRASESIDAKVEYLRMNPVRRGLVRVPEEYRWLYVKRRES